MNGSAPRPIGFWLKLVDRLIDEQFEAILTEHGVTRRQWQLLNVLDRGDADIATLDAAVAPFLAGDPDDPESSVEHLAELLESGWIAREQDRYTVTEVGSTAFERLRLVVGEQRQAVGEGLTEEQYAETLAVLERMARNLGWTDEG
jgi:uncharacterized alpha-E superfamily protein